MANFVVRLLPTPCSLIQMFASLHEGLFSKGPPHGQEKLRLNENRTKVSHWKLFRIFIIYPDTLNFQNNLQFLLCTPLKGLSTLLDIVQDFQFLQPASASLVSKILFSSVFPTKIYPLLNIPDRIS